MSGLQNRLEGLRRVVVEAVGSGAPGEYDNEFDFGSFGLKKNGVLAGAADWLSGYQGEFLRTIRRDFDDPPNKRFDRGSYYNELVVKDLVEGRAVSAMEFLDNAVRVMMRLMHDDGTIQLSSIFDLGSMGHDDATDVALHVIGPYLGQEIAGGIECLIGGVACRALCSDLKGVDNSGVDVNAVKQRLIKVVKEATTGFAVAKSKVVQRLVYKWADEVARYFAR